MGDKRSDGSDKTQPADKQQAGDNAFQGEVRQEAGTVKGSLATKLHADSAQQSNDLVSTGKLPDVHLAAADDKTAHNKPAEHHDGKTASAADGHAGKDGGPGKTHNTENSDEFLKKHPELKPSASEEAKLHKDEEKLEHRIAARQASVDEKQKELDGDFAKLKKDLAAAGVTDIDDPVKAKAELAKLPKEKQDEFKQRMKDYNVDVHTNSLARTDIAEERQKADILKEKLSLSDDLKAIDKLPPDKREQVYKSLDQILDKHDKTQTTGLTDLERHQIANDLVHQISHPEDIKQGTKNTCALASVEDVISRQHPEVYAKAVASIATHGELNGEKVPVDVHKDDGNQERSMASKMFQTAAANMALEDQGAHYQNFKPGEAPKVAGVTPSDDSGERLVTKDGQVQNWPGLTTEQQAKLLDKLTGQNYAPEKISVKDQDSMQKALEAEVAKYGLPLKVGFSYDSGNHTVTVTNIDHSTKPPKIIYDDTAEPRGGKHTMPMDEFYKKAMRGDNLYRAGGKVYQTLTADDDPDYLEVVHRPKV